jgi:hypothetical protein
VVRVAGARTARGPWWRRADAVHVFFFSHFSSLIIDVLDV